MQNNVYIISGGQIKMANKKFTAIKNDYCITFGFDTEFKNADEDKQINQTGFSFTGLSKLEEINQTCTLDVIGVILDVQPTAQLTLKDGSSRDKRTLLIGDESNFSISLTLWGPACEC